MGSSLAANGWTDGLTYSGYSAVPEVLQYMEKVNDICPWIVLHYLYKCHPVLRQLLTKIVTKTTTIPVLMSLLYSNNHLQSLANVLLAGQCKKKS